VAFPAVAANPEVTEAARNGDMKAAREIADSISDPQQKIVAQLAMSAGYADPETPRAPWILCVPSNLFRAAQNILAS